MPKKFIPKFGSFFEITAARKEEEEKGRGEKKKGKRGRKKEENYRRVRL